MEDFISCKIAALVPSDVVESANTEYLKLINDLVRMSKSNADLTEKIYHHVGTNYVLLFALNTMLHYKMQDNSRYEEYRSENDLMSPVLRSLYKDPEENFSTRGAKLCNDISGPGNETHKLNASCLGLVSTMYTTKSLIQLVLRFHNFNWYFDDRKETLLRNEKMFVGTLHAHCIDLALFSLKKGTLSKVK